MASTDHPLLERLSALIEESPDALIGPDGEHWCLEIEDDPDVKRDFPSGALIFAHNGVGDHLFLALDSPGVKVRWHEGNLLEEYCPDPRDLLPDPGRPPSEHPDVFYSEKIHDERIQVLVGDRVQVKVWLFFWRGWQDATVDYVPGLSSFRSDLEYGGLSWVSVHEGSGGTVGVLVDPETHQLRHSVRFVGRAPID